MMLRFFKLYRNRTALVFFLWNLPFYTVAAYVIHAGIWSIPIGMLLAGAHVAMRLPVLIKKTVMGTLSDGPYSHTDIDNFPRRDIDRFERSTAALVSLGFILQGDFGQDSKFAVLSRLFLHPQFHCVAEIQQVFSPQPNPTRLLLWSYFDAAPVRIAYEDGSLIPIASPQSSPQPRDNPVAPNSGHSVASIDTAGSWTSYVTRYERSLVFWTEDASASDLLKAHCKQRAVVAEKLGLPWQSEDLLAVHFAFQRRYQGFLLRRFMQKLALPMYLRGALIGDRDEYWGDLGE